MKRGGRAYRVMMVALLVLLTLCTISNVGDLCWGDTWDNVWIGFANGQFVIQSRENGGTYPHPWFLWGYGWNDIAPVLHWTSPNPKSQVAAAFVLRVPLVWPVGALMLLCMIAISRDIIDRIQRRLRKEGARGFEPIFHD